MLDDILCMIYRCCAYLPLDDAEQTVSSHVHRKQYAVRGVIVPQREALEIYAF